MQANHPKFEIHINSNTEQLWMLIRYNRSYIIVLIKKQTEINKRGKTVKLNEIQWSFFTHLWMTKHSSLVELLYTRHQYL